VFCLKGVITHGKNLRLMKYLAAETAAEGKYVFLAIAVGY
jgi:hypothetical protein